MKLFLVLFLALTGSAFAQSSIVNVRLTNFLASPFPSNTVIRIRPADAKATVVSDLISAGLPERISAPYGNVDQRVMAGKYELTVTEPELPWKLIFNAPGDDTTNSLASLVATNSASLVSANLPFVTQIRAGTNITITPVNGKGAITINASASGAAAVAATNGISAATNAGVVTLSLPTSPYTNGEMAVISGASPSGVNGTYYGQTGSYGKTNPVYTLSGDDLSGWELNDEFGDYNAAAQTLAGPWNVESSIPGATGPTNVAVSPTLGTVLTLPNLALTDPSRLRIPGSSITGAISGTLSGTFSGEVSGTSSGITFTPAAQTNLAAALSGVAEAASMRDEIGVNAWSGVSRTLVSVGGGLQSTYMIAPTMGQLSSNLWAIYYGSYSSGTPSTGRIFAAYGHFTNSFAKHPTPVLEPTPGSWDSGHIGGGRLFQENGTNYLYYFAGTNAGVETVPEDIGVAYSTDGTNWTKYAGNPIITRGGANSTDGRTLYTLCVVKRGSTYYGFYNAMDNIAGKFEEKIHMVTAPHPLGPWTKYAGNPVFSYFSTNYGSQQITSDISLIPMAQGWGAAFWKKQGGVSEYTLATAYTEDFLSWTNGNAIGFGVGPWLFYDHDNRLGMIYSDQTAVKLLYPSKPKLQREQAQSFSVGSLDAHTAKAKFFEGDGSRLTNVTKSSLSPSLQARLDDPATNNGAAVFSSLQAPGIGVTTAGGIQLAAPLQSMNIISNAAEASFYSGAFDVRQHGGYGKSVTIQSVTGSPVLPLSAIGSNNVTGIAVQRNGDVDFAGTSGTYKAHIDGTTGALTNLAAFSLGGGKIYSQDNGIAIPGTNTAGRFQGAIAGTLIDNSTVNSNKFDSPTLLLIANAGKTNNLPALSTTNLTVHGTLEADGLNTPTIIVTNWPANFINPSNIVDGAVTEAKLSSAVQTKLNAASSGYDLLISCTTSNDTALPVYTNALYSSNTWKVSTELIGDGATNYISRSIINTFRGTNSVKTNYTEDVNLTGLGADWYGTTAGAVLAVKGIAGENVNWTVRANWLRQTNGTVASAPAASLAFGSVLGRGYTAGGQSAYAVTTGATVASGDGVVVFVRFGNDATVPTLSDAQGNTYSAIASPSGMQAGWRVFFSKLTTGLGASDTITANFATTDYRTVTVAAFSVTGVGATQPDVTATFYDYITAGAVNLPFTTVADDTVAIAQVVDIGNTQTYTVGSGWTQDGSYLDHAGSRQVWVHQAYTSAGAKQVGGSFPVAETGEALVVAIK